MDISMDIHIHGKPDNQIKSNQITLFQASWPIADRQTDTHKQLHNKHPHSSVGATFLVDREAGVAMSRTFAFVLFVNFT